MRDPTHTGLHARQLLVWSEEAVPMVRGHPASTLLGDVRRAGVDASLVVVVVCGQPIGQALFHICEDCWIAFCQILMLRWVFLNIKETSILTVQCDSVWVVLSTACIGVLRRCPACISKHSIRDQLVSTVDVCVVADW